MKQTKICWAVVWTKKGAKEYGAKDGDIISEDAKSAIHDYNFTIAYPFYDRKLDAQIARDGNKDFKVVKMEITYKQI